MNIKEASLQFGTQMMMSTYMVPSSLDYVTAESAYNNKNKPYIIQLKD